MPEAFVRTAENPGGQHSQPRMLRAAEIHCVKHPVQSRVVAHSSRSQAPQALNPVPSHRQPDATISMLNAQRVQPIADQRCSELQGQ